jgi:hypothetical protein
MPSTTQQPLPTWIKDFNQSHGESNTDKKEKKTPQPKHVSDKQRRAIRGKF